MKLTDAKVSNLKLPGKYFDGLYGLHLLVRPSGKKYWQQRLMVRGKSREYGLGPYPLVSLVEARDLAIDRKREARGGTLPKASRASGIPTLRNAVEEYLAAHEKTWRGQTGEQWRANMKAHVFPRLANTPVNQVTLDDVIGVLEAPALAGLPTVQRNVKNRLSQLMRFAVVKRWRDDNPADARLSAVVKGTNGAGPAHHRALPHGEVGAVLAKLTLIEGQAASALRFLILTAARSAEVLGATWAEIDLDAAVWTIPAARMKVGKEHKVPLCDAACALLSTAPSSNPMELVFARPNGRPITRQHLRTMLLRIDVNATVHGFRSSFRDWCAESGKPRELAEAALAHTVPGVEGAYLRTSMFKRRKVLMLEWAKYILT